VLNAYCVPGAGVTAMLIFAVPLPVAFEAVIVYEVAPDTAVGVPLIAHDVALIESPVGNVGDEVHDVGVSPVKVGVSVVITEFCVNVNGEPEYVMPGAVPVFVVVVLLLLDSAVLTAQFAVNTTKTSRAVKLSLPMAFQSPYLIFSF